jgi:hypothetical protein
MASTGKRRERERERDRERDGQTETRRDKIPNFKFYGDIISKKKKRTFMTLSINALSTNRIFVPELWLVALNLECTCVMNGIA